MIKEMQERDMKKTTNIFRRLCCAAFCLIFILASFITVFAATEYENKELIVGGTLLGLQIQTDGIPIVGIDKVECENGSSSPAHNAGLKPKDIIIKLNGAKVNSSIQVLDAITSCEGKNIELIILRNGSELTISLTPILGKDKKYHAGIWIRDSAAGIGTLTYIDPTTNEFAGLGHGICDGDTAAILPLSSGTVTDVQLSHIVKGKSGSPGEIKGSFKGGKTGSLKKNCSSGIYGIYSVLPENATTKMKVANISDVTEGEAYIRCSVTGSIKEYKLMIEKIDVKSANGKNFSIKITDPELIKITGGIVQGMSGSPIIQNGKLIGAVTHVTINDPTKGYGIYIGNMLQNS